MAYLHWMLSMASPSLTCSHYLTLFRGRGSLCISTILICNFVAPFPSSSLPKDLTENLKVHGPEGVFIMLQLNYKLYYIRYMLHTRTHIYIHLYVHTCVYVCVCVWKATEANECIHYLHLHYNLSVHALLKIKAEIVWTVSATNGSSQLNSKPVRRLLQNITFRGNL